MFHPHVELRLVDDRIGLGLFATRDIPIGTITWILCELEQVFSTADYAGFSPAYRTYLDKYTYATARGDRILCCDVGRYINHSCESNTLTLPDCEVEIAVRDIEAGEQVTDDYGTLRLPEPLRCCCGAASCRQLVLRDDSVRLGSSWASLVEGAADRIEHVEQPLAAFGAPSPRAASRSSSMRKAGLRGAVVRSLERMSASVGARRGTEDVGEEPIGLSLEGAPELRRPG